MDDRPGPSDAVSVTIDPHGRFVAVGSKGPETAFFTRHGKPAGKVETRQGLAHLRFVPSQPLLLGAATYGLLAAIELGETAAGGLDPEVIWEEKLSSNVGRLAVSGDGGMVLTSCFTHGVQRYDLQGVNEGSYHLGGTAAHAVPDFVGRSFAVATTEGDLLLLNSGGNVKWKTTLNRPAIALEVDALGRFLYYGHSTGEIVRMDFDGSKPPTPPKRPAAAAARASGERSGTVRRPDWTVSLAQSDDQAETAVLAILDDPPRIGVFPNTSRLQVFTTEAELLGQAPDCAGVGRILRTAPGWIVSATDRNLVVYDARRHGTNRLDLNLVNLTHLALRPDTFGMAIVQERDRVGRATIAGRWVWRQELRSPVEDLALGSGNLVALTDDGGTLRILDAAGEPAGMYRSEPAEPLCLVAAPAEAPPGLAWVTLARREQVLRGHTLDGQVMWETPVVWEGWQLLRIGKRVVVTAPDGRALSYDGTGHLRGQGKAEDAPSEFVPGPDGEAIRITRQGVHLICSELSGKVRWRAVAEGTLGPLAASPQGVAVFIGRELAWFGEGPRDN